MNRFSLDDVQAQAILDMRLKALQGLDREKLIEERKSLQEKIEYYNQLLSDEEMLKGVLKDELTEIRDKFGDERYTEIQDVSGEVDMEDLSPVEDCVDTLTDLGYIKRLPGSEYSVQNRGGKGMKGMTYRDEDAVKTMFTCSTHDYLMFFTTRGRTYRVKGYEIPEGSRISKGTNIVNILPIEQGERVSAMIQVPDVEGEGYLCMVTRNGVIKRTLASVYRNIRKTGVYAINLDDDDELICVKYTTGNEDLLIATRNGKSIRFNENDARPIGRTARGVKAITLKGDDTVIGMDVLKEGKTVLTISEIGNGKRCSVDKYSIQHRGGQGLKNYDIAKYGHVCSIEVVNEEDDLIVLSSGGKIIRLAIADIKETSGRDSRGVKAMNLGDDEKVMMAVSVPKMEDEDIADEESAQAETPADETNAAE